MEHKITNELPPIPNPAEQSQGLPPAEQNTFPVGAETQAGQAIEAGQSQQIPSYQQAQQPVSLPQPNPAADPGQFQGSPVATAMPAIADDTDLIEKEWIAKAKEIIARTKQDPYQQNKEVEHMKADYMKKRYSKDIKITED